MREKRADHGLDDISISNNSNLEGHYMVAGKEDVYRGVQDQI